MKHLKEHNRRVGIFTNASLIDDDVVDVFRYIDYINISLDAATPETYAKLKYGGSSKGGYFFIQLWKILESL